MEVDKAVYHYHYINNVLWSKYLVSGTVYTADGQSYQRTGILDKTSLTDNSVVVSYTPGVINELREKLIVFEDGHTERLGRYKINRPYLDQQGRPKRLYTVFKDAITFYKYYRLLNDARYCYEIIRGEMPQKPHFDIDINDQENNDETAKYTLYLLFTTLTTIFAEYGINLNWQEDFLLYSSHQHPDGSLAAKRSYHLLIKNYCHANHKEAQSLYQRVIAKEPSLAKYVDAAVYSKNQAFRLLGSAKYESDYNKSRYKRKVREIMLDKLYTWQVGEEHIEVYHSLVGYVKECMLLPPFVEKFNCPQCIEINKQQQHSENNDLFLFTLQQNVLKCSKCTREQINTTQELNIEESKQYLKLVEQNIKEVGSFYIRKIDNNRIDLNKVRRYNCPVCVRSHDNENPFLTVEGDSVYFHCRRENRKVLVHVNKNATDEHCTVTTTTHVESEKPSVNEPPILINNVPPMIKPSGKRTFQVAPILNHTWN